MQILYFIRDRFRWQEIATFDALKVNGYSYEIKYTEEFKDKKRNRKRKIIWFKTSTLEKIVS